jgi:hypothetical protein
MKPEYINAKSWWATQPPIADSQPTPANKAKPNASMLGLVKRYDKHEHVSDASLALDFINRQYKNAISYTARPMGWRGMVMVSGLFSLMLTFSIAPQFLELLGEKYFRAFDYIDLVLSFLFGAVFPFCVILWTFRLELFRPLEECSVFDRKNRKVYMLLKATEPGIKGLFKRWPLHAYELEWDLIDVEHHATLMTTGATLRREHALLFCVRRSESDPTVMYTFQIFPSAILVTDDMVDGLWEHLRRYMEEDGPPLPPGTKVASSTLPDSYWQVLCSIVPLKNYAGWWREELPVALLVHALLPLSLPSILIWAFFGWLTVKTAIPTTWPKEVSDALGPEVPSCLV